MFPAHTQNKHSCSLYLCLPDKWNTVKSLLPSTHGWFIRGQAYCILLPCPPLRLHSNQIPPHWEHHGDNTHIWWGFLQFILCNMQANSSTCSWQQAVGLRGRSYFQSPRSTSGAVFSPLQLARGGRNQQPLPHPGFGASRAPDPEWVLRHGLDSSAVTAFLWWTDLDHRLQTQEQLEEADWCFKARQSKLIPIAKISFSFLSLL